MELFKTQRILLLIKRLRVFILLCLFFLVAEGTNAQGGFILSTTPTTPTVGDTVDLVLQSYFQMSAPNGKSCGRYLSHSDTTVGSNLEFDVFFELIPFSFNAVQCNRIDTFSFVADSAGTYNLVAYWNLQGISPTGAFNNPRFNKDSISISINSLTSLDENDNKRDLYTSNPVSDRLVFFGTEKYLIKSIRIFNLSGELIKETRTGSDQIFIGDLSPGVYILEYSNARNRIIEKLVKN